MAASENLGSDLLPFIKCSHVEQLHIVKSANRLKAFDEITKHGEFIAFLDRICQLYKDEMEQASAPTKKPKQKEKDEMDGRLKQPASKSSGNRTWLFLQHANDLRREFESLFSSQSDINDINALFNFFVFCVVAFMKKRKVDPSIPALARPVSESAVLQSVPCKFKEETESALYRLGGGTLGEIWKLSKKKKDDLKSSAKEKTQYSLHYDLVFRLKMNDEEKLLNLDEELLIRDAGGMFFPKTEFLPFIRKLNESVRQSANTEALQKYGKNMIKVCVAEVTNTTSITALFKNAVQELKIPVDTPELEKFYHVWVRKMTHARVQEFISSHTTQKISKGGHMLRDSLFAQANKPPLKKKKQSTSQKMSNESKEKIKRQQVVTKVDKVESKEKKKRRKVVTKVDKVASKSVLPLKTSPNHLQPLPNVHQNAKPKRLKRKLIFDDFLYD